MRLRHAVAIGVLPSLALFSVAIKSLHAQAVPPSFVVIDVTEITDPGGFSAVTTSAAASPAGVAAFGGHYVIRTATSVSLDGTSPQRLLVIGFDSKEKAQAWYNSPDAREINALRRKTTRSSAFIVDGFAS